MAKTQVKAIDVTKSAILGTFEGECADSTITNLNGLDITREVWEDVFNSDEYQHALEQGWLIGYLGHPEDPECMDFKNACIVMTEGHIEDDGKVYGKFNLIDTPVGRIVKTFQDAGVRFGISVRGLGDITNNSVDPGSFVFRGFDLVAFPAFPESIPEFVSASSDAKKQAQYKAVCAAVRTNISSVTSSATLDMLQSQFAEQSDEFQLVQDRKQQLESMYDDNNANVTINVLQDKLSAMTDLYLAEKSKVLELTEELHKNCMLLASDKKSHHRTVSALKRIVASQIQELETELYDTESELKSVSASYQKLQNKNRKLNQSIHDLTDKNNIMQSRSTELEDKLDAIVASSKELSSERDELVEQIDVVDQDNLKYKRKVDTIQSELLSSAKELDKVNAELTKTVSENTALESKVSNLDAKVRQLEKDNQAIQSCIEEYQDAYAGLYASSIGVHLPKGGVYVSSTTTVDGLRAEIQRSSHVYVDTEDAELTSIDDIDYNLVDDDVITM